MAEYIDRALLNCIRINNLLPRLYGYEPVTVALIGESDDQTNKNSLKTKLIKKYNIRNITVFTEQNKFIIENGKKFDVLIGCRPCQATELILKSATKYKKLFILLPCTCNIIQTKIIKLIRQYPVITHMDAFPGQFKDNHYDSYGWIILFNHMNHKESNK